MANKVPMEFSPFMGPDSLRETSRLLKNLYDLHTKRYCGYTDINGSQYAGTAENWGSEMLLEARKILLDKPALANIFIENKMDFYFDIDYSGFTNTYDQDNMLCAVLRKDVFLDDRSYYIRFENVEKINIPRSQSSSDPHVFSDPFIHTTTPPTLFIINPDNTVEQVSLKLTDITGAETDYYFHIGLETADMYNPETNPTVDGDFITFYLDDSMYGRAFFWMCVNMLKTTPDVDLQPNTFNNTKFLTIGTDGHDRSFLYPILNMTYDETFDFSKYVIKVNAVKNDAFIDNTTSDANYKTSIANIVLLEFDEGWSIGDQPVSETTIEFDHTYTKMSIARGIQWSFRIPQPEDYDYDGITYKNKCYAYIGLDAFINNTNDDSSIERIPVTRVIFSDKYLYNNEELCGNAVSGVHVDVTSDYSNNGVSKKNGVIHSLGDFDGLPPYFKYMINDTIHRAHVETYAIRDKLNDRNQTSLEKQTAGIIIDSAIPQNELQKVGNNMPIVIYFDTADQYNRRYKYTPGDPNISKTNNLSEITFSDPYKFGNSKMSSYAYNDKFVYHGNRHFSLGMMGFDPELETGRVYIVSNDKAAYENNDLSHTPKAPLTFARICDIPTEFAQLTAIKGKAPTVVIDPRYIRTEASFSTEEKEFLYNKTKKDKLLPCDSYLGKYIVWPAGIDVTGAAGQAHIDRYYPRYIHLNDDIDITDENIIEYSIINGGSDYEINDEFIMYIGGISIRGRVKTVDSGIVTSIKFLHYNSQGVLVETDFPELSSHLVKRSNFDGMNNIIDTSTTLGSGSGLKIGVLIDETHWNDTAMRQDDVFPHIEGVFALCQDFYDNIWVYEHDYVTDEFVKTEQFTGLEVFANVNDGDKLDSDYRFTDVFINNMIKPISNWVSNVDDMYFFRDISTVRNTVPLDTDEDLSDYINADNKSTQNTVFVFGQEDDGMHYRRLLKYELGHIYEEAHQEPMEIQKYQDLNVPVYNNKTNKFRFKNVPNSQPSLMLFDPYYDKINKYENISKDVVYINSSKDLLLSDMLMLDNDDEGGTTPIVKNFKLNRNIYIYDEFTKSDMNTKREYFNSLTREILINKLTEDYPESLPLLYESTPYPYTKEMLVDYFVGNNLYWDRVAGHNDLVYTNGPESIYRRPPVKLFRYKNEVITDRTGAPIGDQPTGVFRTISNEIFDPKVKVDNDRGNYSALPAYVFRIDTDEPVQLDGFRLYDELNNDISYESILIINCEVYTSQIQDDQIRWIPVNRHYDPEEA